MSNKKGSEDNWSLTILPSPEPISIKFLTLPFPATAFMTLSTCVVVAGTYGKQILRNAGVTNGRQIKLNAIAEPPDIKIKTHMMNNFCRI